MDTSRRAIEAFPDLATLTRQVAEHFVEAADDAIRASGRFLVALSGGATPVGLYRTLGEAPFSRRVDWSRVQLFWCDERCVPPDDPRSNFRMVHEAMIERLPAQPHVHRMRGEEEPLRAASEYERFMRDAFRIPSGPPIPTPGNRFDLVLLGLGPDGHTASIFPGSMAAHERTRWVIAEYVAAVSMWRITLTPPVINAAAEVWFLVSGDSKRAVLQRVLRGALDPVQIPAQAIAPLDGTLRWFVDAAAYPAQE